jgi:preprotein translocase subunit SecA
MLNEISKILIKIFGSRNERLVKAYSAVVKQVGEFEDRIKISFFDLL